MQALASGGDDPRAEASTSSGGLDGCQLLRPSGTPPSGLDRIGHESMVAVSAEKSTLQAPRHDVDALAAVVTVLAERGQGRAPAEARHGRVADPEGVLARRAVGQELRHQHACGATRSCRARFASGYTRLMPVPNGDAPPDETPGDVRDDPKTAVGRLA
jgi:hypothetical protein